MQSIKHEMLLDSFKCSRCNMVQAARLLGLTGRVMGLRVQKLGIDPRRSRRVR